MGKWWCCRVRQHARSPVMEYVLRAEGVLHHPTDPPNSSLEPEPGFGVQVNAGSPVSSRPYGWAPSARSRCRGARILPLCFPVSLQRLRSLAFPTGHQPVRLNRSTDHVRRR